MLVRRSRTRLATSLAVLALALAAPAVSAGSAAASTVPFGSGALDWGIKASFRDYLASPGTGGVIAPADGATTNADGTFHFPLGTADYDTTTHAVTSSFAGSLHITGHGGQLDIGLAALKLSTSGTTGTLSADTTSKQQDGTTTAVKAVPLLTFAVAQDSFGGGPVTTTLTAEGAKAFGGFYPAGSAMDPLKVVLSQGSGAPSASQGASTPTAPSSGSAAGTSAGTAAATSAATSAAATSAATTGAATTPATAPNSKAEASVATEDSGSSSLPVVLGVGAVIVVLAGGGAFVLRRRRTDQGS
ncbi:hypothetical protein GCM10009839_02230 [Catenulispora yoronensis]|uniref:Htaa domain-containing protein n=1 Tax=Catenulispora yoronensis TaxID=450799 RepID=A0ABP5F147_9ACTN